MTVYQTLVVGTDGSKSLLRAVDRAGQIVAETNAKPGALASRAKIDALIVHTTD